MIRFFFVNVQVQGQYPHQWAPFPGSWLAARMADLTPDLQLSLKLSVVILNWTKVNVISSTLAIILHFGYLVIHVLPHHTKTLILMRHIMSSMTTFSTEIISTFKATKSRLKQLYDKQNSDRPRETTEL